MGIDDVVVCYDGLSEPVLLGARVCVMGEGRARGRVEDTTLRDARMLSIVLVIIPLP